MPAGWEEEIGRREENGPLERALAESVYASEQDEKSEGEDQKEQRERERCVCTNGTSTKRNAREYAYVSRVRETPKES